jgi:hypothetical protein
VNVVQRAATVVAVDVIAVAGGTDALRKAMERIVLGKAGAEHNGVQLIFSAKSMVDTAMKEG